MAVQDTSKRASYEIPNGQWPSKAGVDGLAILGTGRAMFFSLDFAAQPNGITIDLQQEQQLDKLEFCQTIYVENQNNSSPVTFKSAITNQSVIVPAGAQGFFSFMAPKGFTATCLNQVSVVVHAITVAIAPSFWFPNAAIQPGKPATSSLVSGQVVIAVTGTAVQLPANAVTNGIVVRSKSTNNTTQGTIGASGVTNVVNGTGNGFIMAPGDAISLAVTNSNLVYVNGTAGDIFSFIGN